MMTEYDTDCSIELSDLEDHEDVEDDGVAVIGTSVEESSSDDEDSCGFFSDEDQLDENWNRQKGKKGQHPAGDTVDGVAGSDRAIEGKCALCENLEGVTEDELEERCQSATAEGWCKCGNCRVVSYHMKKYDRICCHELTGVVDFIEKDDSTQSQGHQCITLHPNFTSAVLEYGTLYRLHRDHDNVGDTSKARRDRDERDRAHGATCSFVRWIWSRLIYGHRVMPPACVVARIREVHMTSAPFWYFQNFIPGKLRCDFGQHCVAAAKDTYNIK